MKFLAVDTSGKALNVVAVNEDVRVVLRRADCAMQHSVMLMGEIDSALSRAGLSPADCGFFACVVGPGSFTGIRIGIATVKGLCLALGKPALALTSFDCLAYADKSGKKLCLVDAGHGNFYACGYADTEVVLPAAFISRAQADALIAEGYAPVAAAPLFEGVRTADIGAGLSAAALAKAGEARGAHALEALYLRRSSAEEKL